jgi:transposase-like protein
MSTKVYKKLKVINEKNQAIQAVLEQNPDLGSRLTMIQMLIPLGLKAVEYELQQEVRALAGERYSRGKQVKRWGRNPGSVFLGDQKLAIKVPRVRNVAADEEVPLKAYQQLQSPQVIDDMVLGRVINGISQGKYERAVTELPQTFGIKKSSVSKKFIRASAKRLREFLERDLSDHDIVAIFMDGKHFAENEMVIALGVTISGEKIILGFIETSTENHVICRDFLNGLKDRGLRIDKEILFVIDGGKGLRKGIKEVMGERAFIQRCQWHKRENVVEYLDKEKQAQYRRKLTAAYEQATTQKAKQRLDAIRRELRLINESAVNSLDEGMEETLTLHRLGMFKKIGTSFKTTNCIENVNKQLAIYTDRVCRWRKSDQRRRWVASALLEIEPRLNRVGGYEFLKELREAMAKAVAGTEDKRIAA